ncbi:hypothetical protein OMP43_17795 [Sphingomonas sp. CBMAI 2297]|uniref:hypothetical protein n=1 Tax=Sphingomonas sp. CBMAI 2297 TaxID=2991720 RepID=UPI002454D35E|nr:hypothetical protein [Sphingomonas sp. CBMAI 2297]MDH4745882.1 hypothetical protein [Sphingomonas sp. CBMAI 2297]
MHRHVARLLTASAMLGAVPATAQIVPPKTYVTTPTGVNLADASFTYSVDDFQIGPLKLERYQIGSYSADPNTMFFGAHTSHNFDIYVARRLVRPNEWRATVHLGTSASGIFFEGTTIGNGNRDSEGTTLTKVGGQYVYTDASGTIYSFTSAVPAAGATYTGSQRVSTIAFPDGRVQTFSYDGGGKLKLVSDSSGYAIVFDYNASGTVSAACGFNLSRTYVTASSSCTGAALATRYTYTTGSLSSGYTGSLLAGVTDVLGNATAYAWDVNGITCVKPSGYSSCKIANTYGVHGSSWQLRQQTLADGSVWQYGADLGAGMIVEETGFYPDGSNNSGYMDPTGNGLSATFTKSTPYSATDGNGNTTQYRYMGAQEYFTSGPTNSEGTLLTEATFPEGNKYIATYDGANRLIKQVMQAKPGSGLADLVVQLGYGGTTPQNSAKPTSKTDANGNRTDFAYTSWGGMVSEMQPAPVAGAARPLKLYTYMQGYAYVKNSGGALVAAASPVWLPATETLCQTYAGSSAASCDPAAPITVTSYEYGASGTADNLLLRGLVVSSGGVSLRTCYGYDETGNRIFETKPRAGLASCS